jgi:hypothetical protein
VLAPSPAQTIAASPLFSTRLWASGHLDGTIRLYDPRALGAPVGVLSGHIAGVDTLSWSPGSASSLLSVSAAGGEALLWDVGLGTALLRVVLDDEGGEADLGGTTVVEPFPDANVLAACYGIEDPDELAAAWLDVGPDPLLDSGRGRHSRGDHRTDSGGAAARPAAENYDSRFLPFAALLADPELRPLRSVRIPAPNAVAGDADAVCSAAFLPAMGGAHAGVVVTRRGAVLAITSLIEDAIAHDAVLTARCEAAAPGGAMGDHTINASRYLRDPTGAQGIYRPARIINGGAAAVEPQNLPRPPHLPTRRRRVMYNAPAPPSALLLHRRSNQLSQSNPPSQSMPFGGRRSDVLAEQDADDFAAWNGSFDVSFNDDDDDDNDDDNGDNTNNSKHNKNSNDNDSSSNNNDNANGSGDQGADTATGLGDPDLDSVVPTAAEERVVSLIRARAFREAAEKLSFLCSSFIDTVASDRTGGGEADAAVETQSARLSSLAELISCLLDLADTAGSGRARSESTLRLAELACGATPTELDISASLGVFPGAAARAPDPDAFAAFLRSPRASVPQTIDPKSARSVPEADVRGRLAMHRIHIAAIEWSAAISVAGPGGVERAWFSFSFFFFFFFSVFQFFFPSFFSPPFFFLHMFSILIPPSLLRPIQPTMIVCSRSARRSRPGFVPSLRLRYRARSSRGLARR